MPIKEFKPTTPSRRYYSQIDMSDLSKAKPLRKLVESKPSTGGRNSYGCITSRFRGGGHKRKYRIIDFLRSKRGVNGKVLGVEYDPNRSARIALIGYTDGDKRYILCPMGLKTGDSVIAAETADIQIGNALPLRKIPAGTTIHNIEMKVGAGGKLARSAGAMVQLVGFDKGYAQLRMPSGEIRIVNHDCWATIGQVGNLDHENVVIGKAGRNRWLGFRPHNRGVAMNPVDHPMGGGEGKTSGGRHPTTPWGKKTKGKKTRNSKRTNRFIVRRRK